MEALISKSHIKGRLKAPSSKSYTIRALFCAALAEGESTVQDPLDSDDTRAAISVLKKLGAVIEARNGHIRVRGGKLKTPESELYCAESAATLRFLLAVSAHVPGESIITAAPGLAKRPLSDLVSALRQLGVSVETKDGTPPLKIKGGTYRGGKAEIAGNISSQYISALLLSAAFFKGETEIRLTTPPESRPYLLMTIKCLEDFGVTVDCPADLSFFRINRQKYQPASYRVEGDWSSASYLLSLGTVGGEIYVENLNEDSLQADRIIADYLFDMGARLGYDVDGAWALKAELRGIEANLSDSIDLLPTLSTLACLARGKSRFTGIKRARLKESDRVMAVSNNLSNIGISHRVEEDSLAIEGGIPRGAVINPFGDHRIAMAMSIPAVVTGDTVIEDAGCVQKTYPGYWDDLIRAGGRVEIHGK